MQPLAISAWTASSALGAGRTATLAALENGHGGLAPCDFPHVNLDTWIGRVPGLEDAALAEGLGAWNCRNNRLACQGLARTASARPRRARERHGAGNGLRHRRHQHLGHPAKPSAPTANALARDHYPTGSITSTVTPTIRSRISCANVCICRARTDLSTACSSSAKAFATAGGYPGGLCGAAVVGGVDTCA